MITRRNFLLTSIAGVLSAQAQGQELRAALSGDPKNFHPYKVEDEPADTISYLTHASLLRQNRQTQQLEPELATAWKVLEGGRAITFTIRQGLKFSDGTPFTADDVADSFRTLMDSAARYPAADAFRSAEGPFVAQVIAPDKVLLRFPATIAGLERYFDGVRILSSKSPQKDKAGLGPFKFASHQPGVSVRLERNPYYFKRDEQGRQLPYLDAIRFDILQNRDLEAMRLTRGQLHIMNNIAPDMFDRLAAQNPQFARDAGVSTDVEMVWFNQAPQSPIPAYKKAWFTSKEFRRAISSAINRADMCRMVFYNRAEPAGSCVSPANKVWVNSALKPHAFDVAGAKARLQVAGFRLDGATLKDSKGNPVEFSIITNAGNKSRERMAVMIQQDLSKIGMKVNVVTLDFPSLIERITSSYNYEACLLALMNSDLDPGGVMNVWLSSGRQHAWNPVQKSPATPWEAEIDKLMRAQAASLDPRKRKAAFDQVQQIVWEEAPMLYLIYKHSLAGVSPAVSGVAPSPLRPQLLWNAERLRLNSVISSNR